MPGHAEDQLLAEHRDDDKGAGFQAQSGGEIFSALDPPQVK
jgi:hypothetical protein